MNTTPKPYTHYGTHPRILDFSSGEEADKIEIHEDNLVVFRPSRKHKLSFTEVNIGREQIFDLLPATYNGLLDDLVPGSELAEKFQLEWLDFDPLADPMENLSLGVWVYYPQLRHLVRYGNPFWHRLALVMRNSTLQRDSALKFSWQELCALKEGTVVAVAGCSVGNVALHAVVRDLRPLQVKVADCREYHLTNANRVTLSYEDFGRNKAVVTAEQLHKVDPFLKVSVYGEGVHEGNIADFLAGNRERQEPRASVLIEEIDDIEMKIQLREAARKLGITVLMVTDIGSAAQLDVRRFDHSPDLSLIFGISDAELYALLDTFLKDRTREAWYKFFIAVVGRGALSVHEFRRIILKEEPPLFGGAPQLGSTVMTAGGIAAEAVARLILGFPLPERMFFNKQTGEAVIEGERL